MSQYQTLKTQIQQNINQNGEGAIRGDILQTQLLDMINVLGAGYQFMGVATPTNPATAQTPDYKCFYLATTPGTYTNLGGLVVNDGEVAILKYDSTWHKDVTGAATASQLAELVQTINASLKKYITINNHYTVTHNIVNFGINSIIYRNISSGSPIQYYSLDAIYEFSTTKIEYLVLHSTGVIEKISGGANVLATDILLLAYNSLTDSYFGLLADQVNAVKVKTELKESENLLPVNSRLNAYTPLRQSGAGLWVLRSGNAGNSITKEDGYFHVEMSRSANPALWIIRLDLTPYLNKTLRVRFSIKTENELKFIIGSASTIATISASSEWATIERNLTVGNKYGNFRIMLYNNAGTTATFDIKDFGIYDDSNNTELKQLFLQLNSKYFDSDNKLAGKRISILGDSISTFGVPDQNNATGLWTYPGNRCRYPQSNLLTEVNECYWKRLIDENGMFLGVNESWAGSRVSNSQSTDIGDFGPNRCISSQTALRI